MRAELIKTDGTRKAIAPKGSSFELQELYALIGCDLIQVVNAGERILIVDEEGMLTGRPINATASLLAQQPIVGDVVLCDSDMLE